MADYLQENLSVSQSLAGTATTALFSLMLDPMVEEICDIIKNDGNLSLFQPNRLAVFHNDFIYYNGIAHYRVNQNTNLDVSMITVTAKDFADSREFLEKSFAYHDAYAAYRPLEKFLERWVHWLARTFPHIQLVSSFKQALPPELTHWVMWHDENIKLSPEDKYTLQQYLDKHDKYVKRLKSYIFVGTI